MKTRYIYGTRSLSGRRKRPSAKIRALLVTGEHRNRMTDARLMESGSSTDLLDHDDSGVSIVNALEVEEVMYSLLDGLVDTNEDNRGAIKASLLKFASMQPDFTCKSIISFLQVQKTTLSHQVSLITLLCDCLDQYGNNVCTSLIKEILFFMMNEVNLIAGTDARHAEMLKVINACNMLCPEFGLELIQGRLKTIPLNGFTEATCTIVKILTSFLDKVPLSSRIINLGILEQLTSCLYEPGILQAKNVNLCKALVHVLYIIANLISSHHGLSLELLSLSPPNNFDGVLVNALDLADSTLPKFKRAYKAYGHYLKQRLVAGNVKGMALQPHLVETLGVPSEPLNEGVLNQDVIQAVTRSNSIYYSEGVQSSCGSAAPSARRDAPVQGDLGEAVGIDPTEGMGGLGNAGSMSDACNATVGAIVSRLYPVMLDDFLVQVYVAPQYNIACMELLYSLAILLPCLPEAAFERYAPLVLDAIVVRCCNYLPNLKYHKGKNSNRWFDLYKASSGIFTSKIATIFTSIGYPVERSVMLPPTIYVYGLRLTVQAITRIRPYLIFGNIGNISELLFNLLVVFLDCGKQCFFSCVERMDYNFDINKKTHITRMGECGSFLDAANIDECLDFMKQVILTYMVLIQDGSRRIFVLENLFGNLQSPSEKNIIVSLFVLSWVYANKIILASLLESRSFDGKNHILAQGESLSGARLENPDLGVACCMIWRLILELDKFVGKISMASNALVMRLFMNLINHTSKGDWLTFHCLAREISNGQSITDTLPLRFSKAVKRLIEFVVDLKILHDIEERLGQNSRIFANGNTRLSVPFFRKLYGARDLSGLDHTILVAASDCFVSYLLCNCPEMVLVYLMELLLKKQKISMLTTFRYIHTILSWSDSSVIQVLVDDCNLLRCMGIVLVYIHDPVNYFGEAFYGSKLLQQLYMILFKRNLGVGKVADFKSYTGVDSYILDKEGAMVYLDVSKIDHISFHFEQMSKVLDLLNENSNTLQKKMVLDELHLLSQVNICEYNFHGLFKSPTVSFGFTPYHFMGFFNIASVLAHGSILVTSTCIDVLFGLASKPIDAGEHDLDYFANCICQWTHLIKLPTEDELLALTSLKPRRDLNFSNDIPQKIMYHPFLYFVGVESDYLQEELACLRSFIIASFGKWYFREVLYKVYFCLVVNHLKGAVPFSIFGKPSSVLISERTRTIAVGALAHLYTLAPISELQHFCTSGDSTITGHLVYTEDVTRRMLKDIEEHLQAFSKPVDVVKINRCYQIAFGNCNTSPEETGEILEEIGDTNRILKCIIVPLVYLLYNETDALVQLGLIRSLIILVSKIVLKRRDYNEPLQMFLVAIKRIFFILLNPTLRDFGAKLMYNETILIEKHHVEAFTHLERACTNICDVTTWPNSTFIESLPSIQLRGDPECSNVSYACLILLGLFSNIFKSEILNSTCPHSTLYCMLSFADYYYECFFTRTSESEDLVFERYESCGVGNVLQYYMMNILGTWNWDHLAKVLFVLLLVPQKMNPIHIRHRLLACVFFLRRLEFGCHLPSPTFQEQQVPSGWIKVLLLLWAHLLRLQDSVVIGGALANIVSKLLNITCVNLDDYDKLNLVDEDVGTFWIENHLPQSCLVTCIITCLNFLELGGFLADSFAKILHGLLMNRYNEMDSSKFACITRSVFKRFGNAFLVPTVPLFLRRFVLDLGKVDLDALFGAILNPNYGYTRQFQMTVIKLLASDDIMLDKIQTLLQECLLFNTKTRFITINVDFVVNAIEVLGDLTPVTSECEYFAIALVIHLHFMSRSGDVDADLIKRIPATVGRLLKTVIESNQPPRTFCTNVNLTSEANYAASLADLEGAIGGCDTATREVTLEMFCNFCRIASRALLSIPRLAKIFLEQFESAILALEPVNPKMFDTMLGIFCRMLKHKWLVHYDLHVMHVFASLLLCTRGFRLYKASLAYFGNCIKISPSIYTLKISSINFAKHGSLPPAIVAARARSLGLIYNCRAWLDKICDAVIHGLDQENYKHGTLAMEDLQVSFGLYLAVARWLECSQKRPITLDYRLKRLLIQPLGFALLYRGVGSGRVAEVAAKFSRSVYRIFTSGDLIGSSTGNWTTDDAKQLLMQHGQLPKSKLACICGCNNSMVSHETINRLCLTTSFFLLDLASSLFPRECWDLDILCYSSIENEFERLKKNELYKRSHDVLFGGVAHLDSLVALDLQDGVLVCTGKESDANVTMVEDIFQLNLDRHHLGGDGGQVGNEREGNCKGPSLPCPESLLQILDIADYQVKKKTLKRINLFKALSSNGSDGDATTRASFLDIESLEDICHTTLFTSPAIYRYTLFKKYLGRKPLYEAITGNTLVVPELLESAIRLSVALIEAAAGHLHAESRVLIRHIKTTWPHCLESVMRYNAILHYEALCALVTRQLCKMIQVDASLKQNLYASLAAFASMRSAG
ncbi:hypothetical protein BdWA1_000471 [Babesia duncani]|uniref:Uncharacterized protein n=1 Tax=Babesia duncani TaxID=323732 RepID=A0AAD9UPX9_9APIC|nr:hypothetical protein BdWA1_000471 [Babesia duncani]